MLMWKSNSLDDLEKKTEGEKEIEEAERLNRAEKSGLSPRLNLDQYDGSHVDIIEKVHPVHPEL